MEERLTGYEFLFYLPVLSSYELVEKTKLSYFK